MTAESVKLLTLASAKVFELEGQVEEMNALCNLKLRQEISRPSTPAFAPTAKDSESMLHHRRTQIIQGPVRAPVRVPSECKICAA